MITLAYLAAVDTSAVERLLDRAFGSDRQQRTAYRIREGMEAIPELGFAALDDGALVGSIQCWPVAHHGDDGVMTPLIMMGPVAVDPERQRDGIGRLLVAGALEAAGDAAIMLIGDADYYGRFFGFGAERTVRWRLPGPFERGRLLARGEGVPATAGVIGPRATGIDRPARLTGVDADGSAT